MRMPASASAGTIDSFQHAVLLRDELLGPPRDPLQLRERLEPVGRRILRQHVAERLLAQPRHAHHEELVQVRREDRQKLHPLQQRVLRVLGLFQHARIELQPAQLAVDEVLGQKCGLHGAHTAILPRCRGHRRADKNAGLSGRASVLAALSLSFRSAWRKPEMWAAPRRYGVNSFSNYPFCACYEQIAN